MMISNFKRMFFILTFFVFCVIYGEPFSINHNSFGSITSCNKLHPGIWKMSRGVNILNFDPFPAKKDDLKWKLSLFDYTCDRNKTLFYNNEYYNYPDQFHNIYSLSMGSFESTAFLEETLEEHKNSLAEKVGVDPSAILFGGFSLSTNYRQAQKDILQFKKSIVKASAQKTLFSAEFKGPSQNKLNQAFLDDLEILPSTFDIDPIAYEEFINRWGTHYFRMAYFGGEITQTSTLSQSYVEKMTRNGIESEARASLNTYIAKLGTTFPLGLEEPSLSRKFNQNSESTIQYYGGKVNISSDNALAFWLNSLAYNPWIVSGKLESILNLIVDQKIRKEMKIAIQFLSLKAYIEDCSNSLKLARISLFKEPFIDFGKTFTEIKNYCKANIYDAELHQQYGQNIQKLLIQIQDFKENNKIEKKVLDKIPFKWIDFEENKIPPDAILVDKQLNGYPVYICRALVDGVYMVGKFVPMVNVVDICFVPYGIELEKHTFQILTNPLNLKPTWLQYSGIPKGAFLGGTDWDKSPLYVGRTQHEGNTVVGKVNTDTLYYGWGGELRSTTKYEVLLEDNLYPSQSTVCTLKDDTK